MLNAPIPLDESERLAALQRYCVLDTAPEPAFDRLTHILAHILGVPTVLVSLIDTDRQWFKSHHGLDATETPRDISFCGHAVYLRETLIVPDASQDPRFADNPLVSGDLGLRFYAGTPLITSDGFALGTLCAIDYVPRAAPTPDQIDIMVKLADAVVAALELRRFAQHQAEQAMLATLLGQVAVSANQAPDLRSALSGLLPHLARYMGCDVCHVYWQDANAPDTFVSSGLWHVAQGKDYSGLVERPAAIGTTCLGDLPGRVSLNGKPQVISNLANETGSRVKLAASLGLHVGFFFTIQAEGKTQCLIECYGQACTLAHNDLLAVANAVDMQLGRLAERERFEALKDDFVSTVSHELRTPLTSISVALDLLDAGHAGELPPKASKMVRIAQRNTSRLNRLVNDILDIGKIESGRVSLDLLDQPLAGLIERAVTDTAAFALSLDVRLELDVPDASLMALVDADRFIQVIINLLSNAAKFSPTNGVVEVKLGRYQGGIRVSVIDHGPGIPEAFQPQIFQKFAQAAGGDQKHCASTGLGLAIAKKLTVLMGGSVGFDTSATTGTAFHVDLPASS